MYQRKVLNKQVTEEPTKGATTLDALEILTFVLVFSMMAIAVIDMVYSIWLQQPSMLFGVTMTYKERDNTEL